MRKRYHGNGKQLLRENTGETKILISDLNSRKTMHVYEEPGVIKKVRFAQDDKGREVDVYVSAESLRIYDNPWVESVSSNVPGPAMSVMSENPRKRNCEGRSCRVALGAACLLLLAGIIGIGVKMNKDKSKWDTDREQLSSVYADLQKTTDQLNSTNADLREDRDLLWKTFCQPKPRRCRKLLRDDQDKE